MNYDENEQEPITTPDTMNSTKINPQEGDDPSLDKNGYKKWDRMKRINTGAADSFGNRDESVTRMQERKSAFDVIADKLYLIDVHKREGRNIMEDVDMERFAGRKVSIHLIAFCVAVHLVNRDISGRDYHPQRLKNNDQTFVEVADEFDFENRIINSCIQKVSHHV